MAIPNNKKECGFGVLRRVRGEGKIVLLVQSKNGWFHKTYSDMASTKGVAGDYYIFAFPEKSLLTEVENKSGKTYKLQKASVIEAHGFDDFVNANEKFKELAESKCDRIMKDWDVENHASIDDNASPYN